MLQPTGYCLILLCFPEDIALFFVGTNILHHVSKEEDKVIEKEHAIVSGKSFFNVLNLSTNEANKVQEPSIDFFRQMLNVLLIFVTNKVP